MKRTLTFITVLLLASLAAPLQGATPAKPNVILLYIDDLGYADIGCFGGQKARTPNLDRMAAEGVRLTSFYAAPVCTASRTTLMTGCYAKRVGMPGVLGPQGNRGLGKDEKTIAELLKPLGYATMIIGKWHLGDQPEFLPTRRGFDHFFGLPYSNDMDGAADEAAGKPKVRPLLPLLRDETVIEAPAKQNTLTERYADEAVKFLKTHKDDSFFLYLPHTAVHTPHHPGSQFKGKSGKGDYQDWIEEVDWACGRVLDTVRELGISDRTLVLFASDNGGAGAANNAPLRGRKGSTWEGGVRVPFIAWWPGNVPAGAKSAEIACTLDVMPTLVKLCGGKIPTQRTIDGLDILPLLTTKDAKSPRDTFFYFHGGADALEAVRHGPWKYAIAWQPEGGGKKAPETPFVPVLYNLETDVGEQINVVNQHPEVVAQIKKRIANMAADLGIEKKPGPGVRPCATVDNPQPLTKY